MILKTVVQTVEVLYFVDFLANVVGIHQTSVVVFLRHCNAFRVFRDVYFVIHVSCFVVNS